jgi:signal transduction histidine kinase
LAAIHSGRLNSDQQKAALETVARNARAQSKLIEELLDLSGIISGKFTFARDPIIVNEIVISAIEAIQPEALKKEIVLNRELSATPLSISGDAFRLQQALVNVLSNAVKFSQNGGSVTIRLQERNDRAVVEIEDSGAGISPDFLPQIFERFRQGDASRTRGYSGLGLGLAIVRYIADSHGGKVSASSEGAGKGTIVKLEFPLLLHSLLQQ